VPEDDSDAPFMEVRIDPPPDKPEHRRRWIIVGAAVAGVAVIALAAVLAVTQLSGSSKSTTSAKGATSTTVKKGAKGNKLGKGGKYRCQTGSWPTAYHGKPASLAKPIQPSAYLWNDGTGWHVRVLDAATSDTVTVTLTASGTLTHYTVKAFGTVKPTVSGNTATLVVPGSTKSEGMDFSLCTSANFKFDISLKNATWPTANLHTGTSGTATANTFTVSRGS